ncbi:unnamed protein product [Chrysodeixis includens]|uniref:C2H2-type domain-containing protein n=1 Tax=Chrysodeixis includens TaxID=689277 RepID=A0A9P0FYV6_CHRIL|nr:unnamed protein product [Chrysodeixis includens]
MMNRPPWPYMNNGFRGPRPYNNYHQQFRPNHGPHAPSLRRPPGNYGHDVKKEYNEDHWCETCDRGFPTADLLSKHKQQHQKCNIDGCQFIAHPKVITKHIQMQHSTGLYKKIANLNNPEEIQKWREERKKRYPTKVNIEKKAAERKEKIERGEKMFLNCDNKQEKRNVNPTDHRSGLKRRHGFDKQNQNQKPKRQNVDLSKLNNNKPLKVKPKVIPTIPSKVEKNKLKPFSGILDLVMENETDDTVETSNCDDLIEEDYYEQAQKQIIESPIAQEPVLCGALTTLMCDYGSSDEEADDKQEIVAKEEPPVKTETEVKPIQITSPQIIENNKTKIESTVVDNHDTEIESKESDDEAPEEVKIVKTNTEHDNQEPVCKMKEKPPVKKTTPLRNDRYQNHVRKKIPSTLLQKLLHNEMRKERNIVLQCIRHIIKNNYFDKNS